MILQTIFRALLLMIIFPAIPQTQGALDLGFHNDLDLSTFVTRPEIRAPLFQVDTLDPDRVTPGYWFIAPYVNIAQERFARKYYQPCQTGPAIYDNNGDLVWTGACMAGNQNTCDFRIAQHNGSQALSGIFMSAGENKKGEGMILDSSYTVVKNVSTPKLIRDFNMHEFNLIHSGKSALFILNRAEHIELDQDFGSGQGTGWIHNMGFQEVDVETGKTLFQWWAYPEIRPQDSKVKVEGLEGPYPKAWNWFHMNSIDKNSAGDYMISSRFTDSIFKISGKTGRLEWRLDGSGKRSDFDHQQKFNFSRQHDARWLEHSPDREVISLFDNASDGINKTSTYSSVLIVELDKTTRPWTASVVKRWVRPDSSLTHLRGNAQFLENGNLFTCWSDNSYLSEHSPDGDILMTAAFRSKRFVTYRGYKANFTGTPREPPLIKASVYGTSPERSTTVWYVSWNGATEVSSWSFYNSSNATGTALLLGEKRRTGFETSLQTDGYAQFVYAEALAADRTLLGRTPTYEVERPEDWSSMSAPLEVFQSSSKPTMEHWSSGKVIVQSAVPPDPWNSHGCDTTNVIDSAGCSIYGGGCKQSIPRKDIYAVLLERTEL